VPRISSSRLRLRTFYGAETLARLRYFHPILSSLPGAADEQRPLPSNNRPIIRPDLSTQRGGRPAHDPGTIRGPYRIRCVSGCRSFREEISPRVERDSGSPLIRRSRAAVLAARVCKWHVLPSDRLIAPSNFTWRRRRL